MSPPGNAAAPTDLIGRGGEQISGGNRINTHGTTGVNDRRLVEIATLATLAEALSDPTDSFGFAIEADPFSPSLPTVRFRCPTHAESRSHNCGHAHGDVDGDRWHCQSCRHHGTRFELERYVLESVDALDHLRALLVEVAR